MFSLILLFDFRNFSTYQRFLKRRHSIRPRIFWILSDFVLSFLFFLSTSRLNKIENGKIRACLTWKSDSRPIFAFEKNGWGYFFLFKIEILWVHFFMDLLAQKIQLIGILNSPTSCIFDQIKVYSSLTLHKIRMK